MSVRPIKKPADYSALNTKVKYFKAKLIQLYARRLQQIQAELRDNSIIPEEQATLYHIIRRHQRRQKRYISTVTDGNGVTHTTIPAIRRTFYTELKKIDL
jgi:hypothetical protein